MPLSPTVRTSLIWLKILACRSNFSSSTWSVSAPYGIREGGRKIGSKKDVVEPIPSEM